ncbi:MAG: amidase [Pseudomonadota bacterium]|nr:amidase [Pseudomonadota bacterium]
MPPQEDRWNAFVEKAEIECTGSGPLDGLTFAVKDNVAVDGQAFTAGHPLLENRRASATAPSVASLLKAGANFVGMTQTDAGGFGASTPQTSNPAAPDLIVGGSSGGSAAAVAAGICDFAVGTDTGGSVRIPAACTGLTSFKPTYGRVSNDGVWPLTPQLDHVGLIARNMDTLSLAGIVLIEGNENVGEITEGLRVAVETDQAGLFDPSIASELDNIADHLQAAGHDITRISIPGREQIAEAHGVIVLSEAGNIYAELREDERDRLGRAATAGLRHAENLSVEAVDAAWEWARAATDRIQATLEPVDLLLSPTLPISPPRRQARRAVLGGEEVAIVVVMTILTCLANLTGNPVVSLPSPLSPSPLPTGLQLMSALGGDEILLQRAARIESDLKIAAAKSG